MNDYHIPVLLEESIEGLNIMPDGIYADVTFGGGGHSAEILKRLNRGRLFAFDQDEDAANNLPEDQRLVFIQGNFRYLKNYLAYYGIRQINGLIADLGVSSHHFDISDRGFTYRKDAKLDMRMNKNARLSAEMIINDYEAGRLSDLFTDYGELPHAQKLALSIAREREKQRIISTSQLIRCIESLIPRHNENQYLSKLFQAIRIEVNQELENLKEMLTSASEILISGGRMVIISYHSLEDRMVKNFMRWGNTTEQPVKDIYGNRIEPFRVITKKPLTANEQEVSHNPRSRSAKLRIAEKK
jgi:16S rRNA (cytosine1402-N4)-methyltransferase